MSFAVVGIVVGATSAAYKIIDGAKQAKIAKAKRERELKKIKPKKRPVDNEGTKHMWFKPIGAILMLLLI